MQIFVEMYRQSSDKKENVEVDQFEVIVQSSQDSLPQMLTGISTPANLILLYSFSENEYNGETTLSSLYSTGKGWMLREYLYLTEAIKC